MKMCSFKEFTQIHDSCLGTTRHNFIFQNSDAETPERLKTQVVFFECFWRI